MATFLSIPDEIKLNVLSYLTYDEIAKNRVVCTDFNRVCMDALNTGFGRVEVMHSVIQKEIKNKLPRRESERRDHQYSRHADILSAIETRLSLLQITYAKYIEAGYCCFIPGKVLDELEKVLRYVKRVKEPPRSHEVLMELRDISSMAMEHFEDKILPPLRKVLSDEGIAILPGGLTVGLEPPDQRPDNCRHMLKRGSNMTPPGFSPLSKRRRRSTDLGGNSLISPLTARHSPLVDRMAECERFMIEQESKIKELSKQLADYNHRFNDLANALASNFEPSQFKEKIYALIRPVPVADNRNLVADSGNLVTDNRNLVTDNRNLFVDNRNLVADKDAVVDRGLASSSRSVVVTTGRHPTSPPHSSGYTSIISKGHQLYGRRKTKTAEHRAKTLKDNMDTFKDECKL